MDHNLPWPTFEAADSPLSQLIKLSRYFGSNIEFVIAGGGNTSIKTGSRLHIKGSGTSLATIAPEGFVEMAREPLATLLNQDLGSDPDAREERFKRAILAARIHPEKDQRPSVECVLHSLLPRRFVVHTHSTVVNMVTCCQNGETLAHKICGDKILWIPYVDPGFTLAKALDRALGDYALRTGRDCPDAVLMQNHGLIVCGDTPREVLEHTEWVVANIGEHLKRCPSDAPFGPVARIETDRARRLINNLGPILRALLAERDTLKIVTFDDSDIVQSLIGAPGGELAAAGGPLTPDQIVYCNSFPLWFKPAADGGDSKLMGRLRESIDRHTNSTGFPPLVILVEGLGMFCAGDDWAQAETVRLSYRDAIRVMCGAKGLGGIRVLPQRERQFIECWEVESYRRKVAAGIPRQGQVAGRVALVTGAAQGFGLEIAQNLAGEGAHVLLGDINNQLALAQAGLLTGRWGEGRAKALPLDVTDGPTVAAAMHQVVRTYGGLDLLICNAGVLRAGSVKTQPESDFDLVTGVNYKGYFVCVQNAAPIMALQRQARPGYWSDIIQINSKSGLTGSNRNGAYAGSKFGGIGLTQSFALELIEDGIKVNAICPGNYFDGPLWSDPVTGLFVQYLRTGKVPGARTIEDVRRFYEAKVPMGRGCTTTDIMKAVYYLIAQNYETGQAIPVTGGQVMLS
jgi:rhamnose utilization protein RhaD (predicted bifunctional aldolase and dehydrogenase)/NAD(P)-dependent dehydrogenase (short-subunit alcohol dehydrogenase family)